MNHIDTQFTRYEAVFTEFMLTTDEMAREEALFQAGQVGQMLLGAHNAVDQAIELHQRTQSLLAMRWGAALATPAERLARERLVQGDATPLMLALMLPHELAERAHHEQRWRRDSGKLAAMFDQTDELIVLFDAEGQINDINPAFVRSTGWSAQAALSNQASVWQTALPRDTNQLLRGEQSRADGTRYTAEWSVVPVLDRHGELLGHVCVGRDVTHQELITASLRENDKLRAVATLSAGIAHDFNNLLGSINGLAELCELEAPAGSRQARNLGRIRLAGDKAATLVRQMLDFSRQTPRDMHHVWLGATLAASEDLLRASMPKQVELTIRTELDGVALIDVVQMEQVVLNIVRNAVQSMGAEGGRVQVVIDRAEPTINAQVRSEQSRNSHSGRHLVVRISDTGSGIAPDILSKIFDPFFTTKPVGEGTGLGLASAHGIVSSHGGIIEVASQLGQGSHFSIFLPLVEAPALCTGIDAGLLAPSTAGAPSNRTTHPRKTP